MKRIGVLTSGGAHAVQLLKSGVCGKMVTRWHGKLHAVDFDDAFREQHQLETSLYQLVDALAHDKRGRDFAQLCLPNLVGNASADICQSFPTPA